MKLVPNMAALATILMFFHSIPASACGGLFCQNIPVDQAGEQILFHQEGDSITAMVRILYEGNSEDFSWVVPVPTIPELSTGADSLFDELEQLTSPQFILQRTGEACPIDFADAGASDAGTIALSESAADSGGVVIEQSLSVGPFAIDIVSSTNPDEMAIWLEDNNYDLSDRGRELIAPYVEAGMKFVAVKLRSGQSSGSIQPLIMKYQSQKPMVPIKLTAVAAQDDMGVVVWLVSGARAVPENYLHVVPNYTQLNWYTGPRNAYASYQGLITRAMDEAGGQGFATDFAGPITEAITGFMTSAESLEMELDMLDQLSSDGQFLSSLYQGPRTDALRSAYNNFLPLPQGQDESVYFNTPALLVQYTAEELAQARVNLRQAFIDIELDPLKNSSALLPNGRYLTRLYTTLSADEMTVDPVFDFNSEMPAQSRERNATLHEQCINDQTQWSLTLGEGTGRDGEEVIIANMDTPVSVPVEASAQSAVFSTAVTSRSALPQIETQNEFTPVKLNIDDDTGNNNRGGFLGGVSYATLLMTVGFVFWRRRYTQL